LRQKLLGEVAALEKKVRDEKQFNKQVELNDKLKTAETKIGGKQQCLAIYDQILSRHINDNAFCWRLFASLVAA